jgi:alanine-glyoxylate transaminase/serine-glyoxylate transaminase/serine-pyruvate transaminase
MIPGPVEFDQQVLNAMSSLATSHVDPGFINSFGNAIELMRKVWFAPSGQPFIVAGSGTLTWDMTAANLVEAGEDVLVVNSGIFGDWFAECFEVYGAQVDQARAAFGDVPSLEEIESLLKVLTLLHLTKRLKNTNSLVSHMSIPHLVFSQISKALLPSSSGSLLKL